VAVAVLPIRGRSDRCASASLTACPATDSRLMTATGARDTCTCAGAAGPLASCGPRTAAAATAADPAKAIAKILAKVLTRVGFDRLVERGGIKRALDRWSYDASGILAKVVYYAIMLFVLSTAFGVFGSNPISDYLRAVIAYLPLVFVAVVIVVIAAGARNLIENSLGGLSYARVLANLASDSSWPSASSPPWTSCTSPPPWSTPSSTPYWPRSAAGRPPLLIRRGSRPCQRRHGRVPGGGIVIAAGGRRSDEPLPAAVRTRRHGRNCLRRWPVAEWKGPARA
jgi:hypothetical protein